MKTPPKTHQRPIYEYEIYWDGDVQSGGRAVSVRKLRIEARKDVAMNRPYARGKKVTAALFVKYQVGAV